MVMRAILQYRSILIPEVGLSPAQILLHRQLRDHVPANGKHYPPHGERVIQAADRANAFRKRNENDVTSDIYNRKAHPLEPLYARTRVLIQIKNRLDLVGTIVETYLIEHTG